MSTVLLNADLDSASKVTSITLMQLLIWYNVDLRRYCFLELRDGLRIVPVHIILQERSQVEILTVTGSWFAFLNQNGPMIPCFDMATHAEDQRYTKGGVHLSYQ